MLATRNTQIEYDEPLESALSSIADRLKGHYRLSRRTIGLLLLQGDPEIESQVAKQEGSDYSLIRRIVSKTRGAYSQPLGYVIALKQQEAARKILEGAVTLKERSGRGFAERLSRAMMNPITGIPILLGVLYFGLYQFVGVLGAGVLVDFIEGTVFGEWVSPWVTSMAAAFIPFKILQDLFVGEYGIITLGLSYAIAIILPIVGTFFIVFSIIEDSGYLPRLAMLVDRAFKAIGLSGRAVIPIVLGFGCDTMATIVTRTQETKRERVITTLLLALAIPCSAQLGVIFAVLSANGLALLIWGGVIILVFLLVGYLASKVIPGRRTDFYMEVPPLRLPKLSNVMVKTYTRLQWYFVEVLPFFILASVLLWLGNLTGAFDAILGGILEPVVSLIGLPGEAAVPLLYGFFRRDFGAAGLYDLHASGALSGVPLVVTAITLTLFIPCIAQFMVMLKERGVRTTLAVALFIVPFAFLVGFAVNWVLTTLGVSL
jgi:ferrous iron transport protein B